MKLMRVVFLSVLILSVFTAGGQAGIRAPANPPVLFVNLQTGDMSVHDISAGTDLYYEFFDELNNPIKQLTMPTFGNTSAGLFQFQHLVDLQAGYRVRVTDVDSGGSAELTLQHVLITDFTPGSATVSGEAEPGALVDIEVFDGGVNIQSFSQADGSGAWTKDLSTENPGFSITSDMSMVASIHDTDGDRTFHAIYACNTGSEVYYSTDTAYIHACAAGGSVSLQVRQENAVIFGPVELTADQEMWAHAEFWRYGFDLAPGMVVEFEDLTLGRSNAVLIETFYGSHDELTNVISGYAPPNRTIALELGVNGGPVFHAPVTTGVDGSWEYDVGTDVLDGWSGFLYDGRGNAVMADKGETPQRPWVWSDLHHGTILPQSFAPFSGGSVAVFAAGDMTTPLFSTEVTSDENGGMEAYAGQYGVDLQPGMTVSVSNFDAYPGHFYTSTYELEPNRIVNFDPDTKLVQGRASPNELLVVRGYTGSGMVRQEINAQPDGSWQVAFNPALQITTISVWAWDSENNVTAFVLRDGEWVQLVDAGGATLTSTDAQGDQTVVTVPPNAITETVSLSFAVNESPPEVSGSFSFVGQGFSIDAYQDGVPLEDFNFQEPVLLHLEYSDEDVLGVDESSLLLEYWDVGAGDWLDAAETCDPVSEYTRLPAENYLEVAICHLSDFALIGEDLFSVYIPFAFAGQ